FGVRPAEEEDEMAGFEIVSFSELRTPERVERERERVAWERRMMEMRWADRQERERERTREITREAGLRSEWWRMHGGGGTDPGGSGGGGGGGASGSGSGN
ncbi:hypothetical protein TI39_contig831g00021, partial [Zymoseptoria brevis]